MVSNNKKKNNVKNIFHYIIKSFVVTLIRRLRYTISNIIINDCIKNLKISNKRYLIRLILVTVVLSFITYSVYCTC